MCVGKPRAALPIYVAAGHCYPTDRVVVSSIVTSGFTSFTCNTCAKHASRRYSEVHPTPAGHRIRAGTVAYGAKASEATCRAQCAATPACKQAVWTSARAAC